MPNKKQIWYYEGSAAAALAGPLSDQYELRPVPRSVAPFARQHPLAQTRDDAWNEATAPEADGAHVVWLADIERDPVAGPQEGSHDEPRVRWIGVVPDTANSERGPRALERKNGAPHIFAWLTRHAPWELVEKTVEAAFENIELAARERAVREELRRAEWDMEELNRIGIALSSQQSVHGLLSLILQKSRDITGADAGSLYLLEESESGERRLRFKLTQNDSRQFPFSEFTLPLTENSMAGYAALRGAAINLRDAYAIPPEYPYRFNDSYDRESGYRTRSVLTLPMKNVRGEVLGAIQLINCKRRRAAPLDSPEAVDREVVPFPERAERLGMSLASQAAVAYENKKLYGEIESLFEGFVQASVTAIEQRDPTTSGHSFRVSTLTLALAEAVDATTTGPYSASRFNREQMKEIRYAAVLHDFGKVGVREEVLVKARKLFPSQLELVRQRFDYIRKDLEARATQRKLEAVLERGRAGAVPEIHRLDQEYKLRIEELDVYLEFILRVNQPTVLPEGNFDLLNEIARRFFRDPRGVEQPYLSSDEVRLLSIPKGSLDAEERLEIESHVVHTFNFLMQIPWTSELKAIPQIARAHHEKLDGTGYPYKLHSDQIPLQTKMMTICDIFDALSAADRPYKKAVPVERALAILDSSVRQKELDPELFRLFVDAKIYERTLKRP